MEKTCKRCEFDTWVGQEDPLEEEMATHSSIFLPGKSHGQRSLASYSPWGRKRVGHNLVTKQQHIYIYIYIYTHTHTHTNTNKQIYYKYIIYIKKI